MAIYRVFKLGTILTAALIAGVLVGVVPTWAIAVGVFMLWAVSGFAVLEFKSLWEADGFWVLTQDPDAE